VAGTLLICWAAVSPVRAAENCGCKKLTLHTTPPSGGRNLWNRFLADAGNPFVICLQEFDIDLRRIVRHAGDLEFVEVSFDHAPIAPERGITAVARFDSIMAPGFEAVPLHLMYNTRAGIKTAPNDLA
jgi:hypothetical protein